MQLFQLEKRFFSQISLLLKISQFNKKIKDLKLKICKLFERYKAGEKKLLLKRELIKNLKNFFLVRDIVC